MAFYQFPTSKWSLLIGFIFSYFITWNIFYIVIALSAAFSLYFFYLFIIFIFIVEAGFGGLGFSYIYLFLTGGASCFLMDDFLRFKVVSFSGCGSSITYGSKISACTAISWFLSFRDSYDLFDSLLAWIIFFNTLGAYIYSFIGVY
mgnify:CR=1 FL=1